MAQLFQLQVMSSSNNIAAFLSVGARGNVLPKYSIYVLAGDSAESSMFSF